MSAEMTIAELRALGCSACGGDVDAEGQCLDCGRWISGLEPWGTYCTEDCPEDCSADHQGEE